MSEPTPLDGEGDQTPGRIRALIATMGAGVELLETPIEWVTGWIQTIAEFWGS